MNFIMPRSNFAAVLQVPGFEGTAPFEKNFALGTDALQRTFVFNMLPTGAKCKIFLKRRFKTAAKQIAPWHDEIEVYVIKQKHWINKINMQLFD